MTDGPRARRGSRARLPRGRGPPPLERGSGVRARRSRSRHSTALEGVAQPPRPRQPLPPASAGLPSASAGLPSASAGLPSASAGLPSASESESESDSLSASASPRRARSPRQPSGTSDLRRGRGRIRSPAVSGSASGGDRCSSSRPTIGPACSGSPARARARTRARADHELDVDLDLILALVLVPLAFVTTGVLTDSVTTVVLTSPPEGLRRDRRLDFELGPKDHRARVVGLGPDHDLDLDLAFVTTGVLTDSVRVISTGHCNTA